MASSSDEITLQLNSLLEKHNDKEDVEIIIILLEDRIYQLIDETLKKDFRSYIVSLKECIKIRKYSEEIFQSLSKNKIELESPKSRSRYEEGITESIDNYLDKIWIINFHDQKPPLKYARIIQLQSYLASVWSVYDLIGKIIQIICTKTKTIFTNCPLKLLKKFLYQFEDKFEKIPEGITNNFSSILISYKLRNAFLHASGQENLFNNILIDPETVDPLNREKIENIYKVSEISNFDLFFTEVESL